MGFKNLNNINNIVLNTNPTVGVHEEGNVYYNNTWKTMDVAMDDDITLQVGQEDLRMVYNATGVTIYNGEAVYTDGVYTGGTNNVVTAALAQANTVSTANALGCATQDILNDSYGFICVRGHVNGLDTNEIGRAYLQTQNLFFSARVGGTAGNAYTLTVIDTTTGGLSYTEAGGNIIIDLGGTTPTVAQVVTEMMVTHPSAIVKVKATGSGNLVVASILSFANGVNTVEGDVLYLSAVDAGFLTPTAPSAPNLKIRMGRLITKDAVNGRINIRIVPLSRLQDLSDVTITSPVNGDIIVYDYATSSWKNVPNTIPTYDTLTEMKTATGVADLSVICQETSSIYIYATNGITPINYGTPDDKYVTITGNGGNTRWIATSGLYCWAAKGGTFITNRLIAGTETTPMIISGDTDLGDNVSSQILLNVTGSDHDIILPSNTESVGSQFLTLTVIGTSAYSVNIQTTYTNLNHAYILGPDQSAFFMFGQNMWHLMGGKEAILQMAQIGNPTYRTFQDWSDVIQSGGLLTGGTLTDDGAGGVNVAALTAICKVANSAVAENVFMDMSSGNVPSASLTNQSVNYIYVDYNGGTPTYGVSTVRDEVRQTDQFIIGFVFKNGTEVECLGYSEITNFDRRSVDRWIDVYGVQRVSGAVISEVNNRYLQSTAGLFYYGIQRIITEGKNTYTGDTFEVYFRNGTGGWNIIGGETQVDNLRYDNNLTPVAVGSGVKSCTNNGSGLIRVETNAVHGLATNDYVTIAGVTGTTEANGSWRIDVHSTTEFDLIGSTFVHTYVSGGTVNNLPLANLTNDGTHYGIFWIFICTEGDIYVLYGQGDYTLTAAQNATLPANLPPYMSYNTVIAAKAIVLRGATNFTEIQSAYTTPFAVTTPAVHNDLSGLQGGTSNQYYHLTQAEHSVVANSGITSGMVNKVALYYTSPTGKILADNVLDADASNNISLYITPHSLTVNRMYTVPDAGADANFMMSEGSQTVNGVPYFTAGIKTPYVYPNADGTSAWQVRKANGTTAFVNANTTDLVFSVYGTGASTILNLANTCINTYDTVNGYIQNNIQNLSTGTEAETDWIATADNGNDTTNYINMGINGSGFTGGSFFPGGWTINGADDGYLYASDGELAIGTTNHASPKAIRFFTDYPLIANQKGMITGGGLWSNGPHTPTAWMHLRAGGSTAGTAPLKLTSGTILSSPEDGALEYNNALYFTIGSTRASFILSEGNQTINGTKTFSATISGSVTGNAGTATKSTNLIGGNNTTLLGSMPYQSNTDTTTLLSPNTTIVKQFLSQTGTGTNGAAPVWSGVSISDVGGILATGATVGATSQAQAFTTGVKTSNVFPATDSTTAFQVRKADGSTSVVNVDTTNSRVFVGGSTAPTAELHLAAATGGATAGSAPLKFTSGTLLSTPEAGAKEYNGAYYQTIANATRVATGGVLYVDTADHTGTATTTEQTLSTYTLPANTLSVNGSYIEIDALITTIAGGGTLTVRVYFGATAIYVSNAATMPSSNARFRAKVYRTGSANQKSIASATVFSNDAITVGSYYAAPTETLSGTVTVRITAQQSSSGTRFTGRTFEVKYFGAPA